MQKMGSLVLLLTAPHYMILAISDVDSFVSTALGKAQTNFTVH